MSTQSGTTMGTKHNSLLPLPIAVIVSVILLGLALSACSTLSGSGVAESTTVYQEAVRSRDGIGKFYMGREIAQVMGHTGAGWLERSGREAQEQPQQVVKALGLEPTDVVADIGAGTGYFSFRISPLVPQGKVLAVDIQPEMLEMIDRLKRQRSIANVEPVLGSITNPNLPIASVDLALIVDAYHEFSHPREVMEAVVKALKPGGRVVLVEYRGENPLVPIKALHKMTQRQVRKEMQAVGLVWRETKSTLPQQHLMVFEAE